MKYTYATLILDETDAEINERNLVAVLEAAGVDDVSRSRVRAMVAALEGVDVGAHADAGGATDAGTSAAVDGSDGSAGADETESGGASRPDEDGLEDASSPDARESGDASGPDDVSGGS